MKNHWQILMASLVILIVLFIIFGGEKIIESDSSQKQIPKADIDLPLKNEAQYTESFNKAMRDKREKDKNRSPDAKAKDKALLTLLMELSQKAIDSINFSGKVLDQYGNPVPGVLVRYYGHNAVYAAGSGYQESVTDGEGVFTVENFKGSAFTVEKLTKAGYDFTGRVRFINDNSGNTEGISWKSYSQKKPYIFKGWKVEHYPKVKTQSNLPFLFTPDGRKGTFNLLETGKDFLKKGVHEGDFIVSFLKTGNMWTVRLEAINGGLLETIDPLMNLAPKSGYRDFYEYQFPLDGQNSAIKRFYFTSRGGSQFGKLNIDIDAYGEKGGLLLSYVLNLENSRELAVKSE